MKAAAQLINTTHKLQFVVGIISNNAYDLLSSALHSWQPHNIVDDTFYH